MGDGAGVMAQWLKVHDALPEDPDLVLSTYIMAHNCLLASMGTEHMWYTGTHVDKISISIKLKRKTLLKLSHPWTYELPDTSGLPSTSAEVSGAKSLAVETCSCVWEIFTPLSETQAWVKERWSSTGRCEVG